MKVTLMQAKQAESVLAKILNQSVLEIHIAYRFSKLAKAVSPELTQLEEQRVALVKKLGTENEEGNLEVGADSMEEFLSQYNTLLKEEIELPFKKVQLKELNGLKLSPNELISIEPFFISPVDDVEDAAETEG